MKTKKIIIILISVLIVAAIAATVALSIAAADDDMTIAEYCAKMFNNPEKFDSETLVLINGKKLSVSSIDMTIKMAQAGGGIVTGDSIDRAIEGYIDRKLLLSEAQRRGITVEKEVIEEHLAYQRDLLLEGLENGDNGPKVFEEYCKELGMTLDEYFAQDDVYRQYEEMFIADKLVAQEAEAQGATTYEEIAAVRADLAKTLRSKAEIVINQECLDKVKREAEKASVKTDLAVE